MDKIKIVALFGESSAGKDTLINSLMSRDKQERFHRIVSCTTRPPRDYEVNGKDYYFLSSKQFLIRVLDGRMLEATQFKDWYYGTSLDTLEPDKINIGIFNIQAIANLIINEENLEIYPVYVKTDPKTRLLRSLKREENPDCTEICRRFLADEIDFSWIHDKESLPLFTFNTINSFAEKTLWHRIMGNELKVANTLINPALLD